jgi:Ankyrin repeats (3 copies)
LPDKYIKMRATKILLILIISFLFTSAHAEKQERNKIIYDMLNEKNNRLFIFFKMPNDNQRTLRVQNDEISRKFIFSLLLQKPDIAKILQNKSINLNIPVVIDSCELNNGFQNKIIFEATCKTDIKYMHVTAQMTLTPLQATCLTGDLAAMQMLIRAGASINNDAETLSPLVSCLTSKKLNQVIFLLGEGANVNSQNKHAPFSPLSLLSIVYASDSDQAAAVKLAKLMISKGADLHYRAKDGDNELHRAARVGNLAIVEVLLEMGVDINAKNEAGLSPLGAAEKNNKPEVVEFLISKGAQR